MADLSRRGWVVRIRHTHNTDNLHRLRLRQHGRGVVLPATRCPLQRGDIARLELLAVTGGSARRRGLQLGSRQTERGAQNLRADDGHRQQKDIARDASDRAAHNASITRRASGLPNAVCAELPGSHGRPDRVRAGCSRREQELCPIWRRPLASCSAPILLLRASAPCQNRERRRRSIVEGMPQRGNA